MKLLPLKNHANQAAHLIVVKISEYMRREVLCKRGENQRQNAQH